MGDDNDNSLLSAPKEPDGFKHESPIRAFNTFTINGRYAIGKGFRPSLQHITAYLDALEQKEGWRLVQILDPTGGSPSFVLRQDPPSPTLPPLDGFGEPAMPGFKGPYMEAGEPFSLLREREPTFTHAYDSDRVKIAIATDGIMHYFTPGELSAAFKHDKRLPGWLHDAALGRRSTLTPAEPGEKLTVERVNHPTHYNKHPSGLEAIDIIEFMPANLSHAVKYLWRFGEKDDPIEQLKKAGWYFKREYERRDTMGPALLNVLDEEKTAFELNYTRFRDKNGSLERAIGAWLDDLRDPTAVDTAITESIKLCRPGKSGNLTLSRIVRNLTAEIRSLERKRKKDAGDED